MNWFEKYARETSETDVISSGRGSVGLLAAGLLGEAGSIVSEVKKRARERGAYPAHEHRVEEEIGDFLWYFARVTASVDPAIWASFPPSRSAQLAVRRTWRQRHAVDASVSLACAAGRFVDALVREDRVSARAQALEVWSALSAAAASLNIDLRAAAVYNREKTLSRWPQRRVYLPLFDESFPVEEQLPRRLRVVFVERRRQGKDVTTLRCNGLNFGDRLTDNSDEPDFYRYHDVFHFSYACHLGWSPVVRALLRCKRKSDPRIDEVQDGARAGIIEEAVSATVFARARKMRLFEGADRIDFDLLKIIQEFVRDYEVSRLPLWQWEAAILNGYEVFRLLCRNRGGVVTLDLARRRLRFERRPLEIVPRRAVRSSRT